MLGRSVWCHIKKEALLLWWRRWSRLGVDLGRVSGFVSAVFCVLSEALLKRILWCEIFISDLACHKSSTPSD